VLVESVYINASLNCQLEEYLMIIHVEALEGRNRRKKKKCMKDVAIPRNSCSYVIDVTTLVLNSGSVP
jgi:hypothetical protein